MEKKKRPQPGGQGPSPVPEPQTCRQPEYVYGKKNPFFKGSAIENLAAKLSRD